KLLRRRHLREALGRDAGPIGEPRGEARTRRPVPRRQTKGATPGADVVLREPRLDQQVADAVVSSGTQAWTVVGEVVDVHTVEHDGESATGSLGHGDREQVILAEEAAIGRVRRVAVDRELVDVDHEVGGTERPGDALRRVD